MENPGGGLAGQDRSSWLRTAENFMIVVAGEALMDVFVAGETGDGLALDARIGGSPFNVAIGLARLEQPVGFLGAIGRGRLGDRLV